jgi:hypothetical protein
MPLATLSIDLEARLANLQAGFDQASRLAEKSVDKIQRQFDGLRSGAVAVGAALGAAFSVTQLTQFIGRTVDGLDALNDLKDATGSSIENLSALEDVAARTGTSFESMSGALVKFNKVLVDAKPGSETAATLKQIGLNAEELKKIDPAEALRQTALALAGFADDGNKARIIQDLFGKSVREAAPFLKDLSEQSQLNAKVTTEQAQAAEDFNKQLFNLQKNSTDAGRAIVSDLIPALNTFFERLKGIKAAGGIGALFGSVGNEFKANLISQEIEDVVRQIEQVQKRLDFGNADEKSGLERQMAALRAEFMRLQREAGTTKDALLGFSDTVKPLPGAKADGSAAAGDKPSAGGVPGKAAKDRTLSAEKIAQLQAEAEEAAAKDTAEAWDYYNKLVLKDHKETTDATALMWKQWFETIDAEQDAAIEEGKAFIDSKGEQMSEFAKEASRNIQDSLGETIKRGLKGDFESIQELWADMILNLIVQAEAAKLNQYLFGDSVGGSSGGWGALIGKFFGGGSSAGAGAAATTGGDSAFGFEGLASVRSTAASASKRSSAPSIVIQQTNNIGQGVSRAEVETAIRSANAETQQSIRRSLKQGTFA